MLSFFRNLSLSLLVNVMLVKKHNGQGWIIFKLITIRGDASNFRLVQRSYESTYPTWFKASFVRLLIIQNNSTVYSFKNCMTGSLAANLSKIFIVIFINPILEEEMQIISAIRSGRKNSLTQNFSTFNIYKYIYIYMAYF